MKNSQRPVVVFDSGLGGISVLKKLIATMPNESFVYYGDSANAPYGPRAPHEICRLTVEGVARLDSLQPKAIVIACNTATAAAQDALEHAYPHIPVIGIEPAVRRAVQENPGGRILSLATAGTLASARYQRQLQEIAASEQVVSIAAPGIVNYVEDGMRDREGVVAYLRRLFAPGSRRVLTVWCWAAPISPLPPLRFRRLWAVRCAFMNRAIPLPGRPGGGWPRREPPARTTTAAALPL